MQLRLPGQPHLTYCTNIHPGETWPEVRENLSHHVLAVKSRVARAEPFGVGLRLSAKAAKALSHPEELESLRVFLDANGLYVFTLNGFPYGAFHGRRIKELVYLPDWTDDRRLAYTDRLSLLLSALLPPGLEGTVSTVPVGFKAALSQSGLTAAAERLLRHAAFLHEVRERSGKTLLLALEPEPCCILETIAETVEFFEEHLFSSSARETFSRISGLSPSQSEAALRRHLGVCLDACHMAVEFEEPSRTLGALRRSEIRIGKVQISAGLKVLFGGGADGVSSLERFVEDVYLHQVVERSPEALHRYVDLSEALRALRQRAGRPLEWRVHFHVPLFQERLGPFLNTQDFLRELLGYVKTKDICRHLEIETYTWEVLPREYRSEGIVDSITREFEWIRQQLSL